MYVSSGSCLVQGVGSLVQVCSQARLSDVVFSPALAGHRQVTALQHRRGMLQNYCNWQKKDVPGQQMLIKNSLLPLMKAEEPSEDVYGISRQGVKAAHLIFLKE